MKRVGIQYIIESIEDSLCLKMSNTFLKLNNMIDECNSNIRNAMQSLDESNDTLNDIDSNGISKNISDIGTLLNQIETNKSSFDGKTEILIEKQTSFNDILSSLNTSLDELESNCDNLNDLLRNIATKVGGGIVDKFRPYV